MQQLGWSVNTKDDPVLKVPLQFHFEPVQILSKQLTKLNSTSPYRIYYLGPRFNNSSLFHKMYSQKHGYQYDLMKVNKNNNFFSESMTNNQFYRNQIYYRAFQGMNPTINPQTEIFFDSKFQSGNLDCVVKVGQSEYDLFLRIDSNTRGHLFWFYFSVTNAKPEETVKFNICNLSKSRSLYQKNFKPYAFRQNSEQENQVWTQDKVKNVKYQSKKLRYDFIYDKISKSRKFYELSFTYTFSSQQQLVKFAYCIPYTYSELNKQLKQFGNIAQIGKLGKSLTGVDIPLVKIGEYQPEKRKPIVLVTGRIHPGQSNGSIILSGLMKFLCLSPQAQFLRKKVIFLIVPMINPDGVIIGNSRTGASGKDLNRQFRSSNNYLFPEVSQLKKLVGKVLQTHQIDIYLDFHGHSAKKNLFVFGPQYNITQMDYYRSRIFPKLLSNITPTFRYFGSNFTIPEGKKNTARAVMFNQFAIPLVYTVQCSVGIYRDYKSHKDCPFLRTQWENLGQNIGLSLKQYFQNMDQYQTYLQQKKLNKIKGQKPQKNKDKEQDKSNEPSIMKKTFNFSKPKDLKIMKIFQQIKLLQQKVPKKNKNQYDQSDGSSDSHNQDQDLQKMKMQEFQGMITDGVQYQNQIFRKNDANQKANKSTSLFEPVKTKRRQKKSMKIDQNSFIQDFINNVSPPKNQSFIATRTVIKSQRNLRQKKQEQQIPKIQPKIKLEKIGRQKQTQPRYEADIKFFSQEIVHYAQANKTNNVPKQNVTIYNFSKMIQNPKSVRYNEYESYEKSKLISNKRKSDTIDQIPHTFYQKQPKLNRMSLLNNMPEFMQFRSIDSRQKKQQTLQTGRSIKNRNAYPVSFYRIKYQNRNRKRRQQQSQNFNIKNSQQFSARSYDDRGHNFLNIKKVNKH